MAGGSTVLFRGTYVESDMSSSADDLQFHRADYGATPATRPTCPGCRQPIERVYYMVGKQAFVKSKIDGRFFPYTHAPEVAPGLF